VKFNFSTLASSFGEGGLSGVATDQAGNIYVAGYLETSPGTVEVLVASFDKTGAYVWSQTYNGGFGPRDQGAGIAVLDDGLSTPTSVTLYVTGSIGNGTLGQTDGFVAELDSTGLLIGNGSVTISNSDLQGIVLAPDPSGTGTDVFVSGTSIDAGSGAKTILTAAFDSGLNAPALYASTISLGNLQGSVHGAQSIAIDPATANTYLVGTASDGTDSSPVVVAYNGFSSTTPFDPVSYPNPVYGGAGQGGAIALQAGGLYLIGTLFDSNGGTLLSSDLLVARLDLAGNQVTNYVWSVATNGVREGDWTGNGLVVNAANEPIITGAAFDPVQMTAGVDVHATHFNANGSATQNGTGRPENTFGGTDMDVGNAVILDPSNPGSVLVVGTTQSVDFPTTWLPYGGGPSSGFLVSVPV
jgi:hypothetical protein